MSTKESEVVEKVVSPEVAAFRQNLLVFAKDFVSTRKRSVADLEEIKKQVSVFKKRAIELKLVFFDEFHSATDKVYQSVGKTTDKGDDSKEAS